MLIFFYYRKRVRVTRIRNSHWSLWPIRF